MKNLIILSAILLLSGCTLFGAKFDNNEMASVARIAVESKLAAETCSDTLSTVRAIRSLKKEAMFFETYTKHLPDNNESHKIAIIINETILEMEERYKTSDPSIGYCKIKLLIIKKQAIRTLESVGDKVR